MISPNNRLALALTSVGGFFALSSGAGGAAVGVIRESKEAAMAASGHEQAQPEADADGARDFDFWRGEWKVHNRRLRERLKGSTEWVEFEATSVAHPLPDGLGNEDEYRTDFGGGFVGMSFRFFQRATKQWAIYWADSRYGTVDPPVIGSFRGDVGTFEGADTFEGRPIRVRFIWSRIRSGAPRWEQAFSDDGGKTWETNWVMEMTRVDASGGVIPSDHVEHLQDFPIIELRRYALHPGQRDEFVRYFESFFPEAFQQLGAIAFGQFRERQDPNAFTWIRGFRSAEARGIANSAFYYEPLWKEHAETMNDRLVDSDNVLLLRPWKPGRGIPVLPVVDPMRAAAGGGAGEGIVVAEVFPVKAGSVDAFAERMESVFARYRAAGVREAGVLVTLDGRNTFPQHPVRTDGPYLVWLGIAADESSVEKRFASVVEDSRQSLAADPLLRGKPELIFLDPTGRSRLRWLSER